ncbi:MAG: hypothetical protein FD180_504 [Planctomycetota bacterium]|nr:MAG: hypothetical protein FD180_504 [Planctomycetota bacterium]
MKTIAVLVILGTTSVVSAETPASANAALGYWRAFSMIQAPEADDAIWMKCDDVAEGRAAWDDAALGGLVDKNAGACLELHKASLKSSCDFGLAFEDGYEMTLPHLAKARQLARLNLLRATRLDSVGNGGEAVEAWLDGLRMARHIAADPVLISSLVGKVIFKGHVEAMVRFVGRGAAGKVERARIAQAVREVPAYGWDWGAGIAEEKRTAGQLVKRYLEMDNPETAIRELLACVGGIEAAGKKSDKALAEVLEEFGVAVEMAKDLEKFRAYMKQALKEYEALMDEIAAALRKPAHEGRAELERIGAIPKGTNLVINLLAPGMAAIGRSRAELEVLRAGLIALVAVASHRVEKGEDPASMAGLLAPDDPFTGKPLALAAATEGLVIRSEGKDLEGKHYEFLLKK